jgi:hypothetical protein
MTHGGGGVLFCSFISSVGIAVISLPHKQDLNPVVSDTGDRGLFYFFAFVFSSVFRFRLLQATSLLIGPFKKAFHGILSL